MGILELLKIAEVAVFPFLALLNRTWWFSATVAMPHS
jgi:hypothetical protein